VTGKASRLRDLHGESVRNLAALLATMTSCRTTRQRRPQAGQVWWWAIRWLKSESFWQGIAIQTLSTLIAALVVALVAILAGVGYTAAIRYFVIYGLILLLIFVAYVTALNAISKLLVRTLLHVRWRLPMRGPSIFAHSTGHCDISARSTTIRSRVGPLDRVHPRLGLGDQPPVSNQSGNVVGAPGS
jgi:hypothetical protein